MGEQAGRGKLPIMLERPHATPGFGESFVFSSVIRVSGLGFKKRVCLQSSGKLGFRGVYVRTHHAQHKLHPLPGRQQRDNLLRADDAGCASGLHGSRPGGPFGTCSKCGAKSHDSQPQAQPGRWAKQTSKPRVQGLGFRGSSRAILLELKGGGGDGSPGSF